MRKIREKGLVSVFIAIILLINLTTIVYIMADGMATEKSLEINTINKLKWIVPLGKYKHLESSPDKPGFLVFQEEDSFGVLDKQGQVRVPPLYNFVGLEGDGDLFLCNHHSKFGYASKRGGQAIPFIYDNAFGFSRGYALVKKDSHYQVIDDIGGLAFENPENYGLWPTEKKGYFTFWERPDSKGKDTDDVYDFYKGLLRIDGDDPTKAQILIKPDRYVDWFKYSEGFWLTEYLPNPSLRVPVFLKDESFEIAFPDLNFHFALPFSEGLAPIALYGEDADLENRENLIVDFGYMDYEGNLLLSDFPFDARSPFKEGLASGFDQKGLYYINTLGKTVIHIPRKGNFIYSKENFSEGYACVKVGDRWGYIDKNGNFVIDPVFHDAYPVLGNIAVVYYGGKFGAIEVK